MGMLAAQSMLSVQGDYGVGDNFFELFTHVTHFFDCKVCEMYGRIISDV